MVGSRTSEIGLNTNTGISYVSIVYLVDECTKGNFTYQLLKLNLNSVWFFKYY
jgi:hypothetical protein